MINLSAHRNLAAANKIKKIPNNVSDESNFRQVKMLQELSNEVREMLGVFCPGDILINGYPPIHYNDGFNCRIVAVSAHWEVYRKREVGGGFVGVVDDPNNRNLIDEEAISVGLIYLNSDIYGNIVIPCRGVHLRCFANVVAKLIWENYEISDTTWRLRATKFYGGPIDGSGHTIYFFALTPVGQWPSL